MKYLTNNNRNVLKVLQRFPQELSTLLENVNEINTKQFKEKNTPFNLCFFNNTRKQVNTMWNTKLKKADNLFIKEDISIAHSQDVYIYEDLPVIAMKTKKEDKSTLYANSETFKVVSFTNEKIVKQMYSFG